MSLSVFKFWEDHESAGKYLRMSVAALVLIHACTNLNRCQILTGIAGHIDGRSVSQSVSQSSNLRFYIHQRLRKNRGIFFAARREAIIERGDFKAENARSVRQEDI